MRIFMALAVYADVTVGMSTSLIQAFAHFRRTGHTLDIRANNGDALVSRARSILASQMLGTDAEVLISIDADIIFQSGAITRVCEKALETGHIIGGLYTTRGSEIRIALKVPAGRHQFPTDELIEAEYVNTGFMAVPRKVFEDVAEDLERVHLADDWMCKGGWWPFYMPFVHNGLYLSEDWAFCQRAADHGYKCYVDNSIVLGHLGRKVFWVAETGDGPALHPQNYADGTEPWVTSLISALVRSLPNAQLYVEIGCLNGRTVQTVLEDNLTVNAIGVDVQPIPFEHDRFHAVIGDSKEVLATLDGVRPDLVFVDGGHDYETALSDIRWAQGREATVIAVHDIYSFPEVGRAARDAATEGWGIVELPVGQFPWYGQTGLALMTRR